MNFLWALLAVVTLGHFEPASRADQRREWRILEGASPLDFIKLDCRRRWIPVLLPPKYLVSLNCVPLVAADITRPVPDAAEHENKGMVSRRRNINRKAKFAFSGGSRSYTSSPFGISLDMRCDEITHLWVILRCLSVPSKFKPINVKGGRGPGILDFVASNDAYREPDSLDVNGPEAFNLNVFNREPRPLSILSDGVRNLRFLKSRFDQPNTDSTQNHSNDRSRGHDISPERGLALCYKIVLVVLILALCVFGFLKAFDAFEAGDSDTGLGYLIASVAGILVGISAGLPFIIGGL